MNVITFTAFKEELAKLSSVGHAAVDIAGLGILARPTVQKMRGKEVSEKSEHLHEIGGLGTLAAGVAHEHRHEFADAAKKGFGAIKRGVGKVVGKKGAAAAKRGVEMLGRGIAKRASLVDGALSIFKVSGVAVPMMRNALHAGDAAAHAVQRGGKAAGTIMNATRAAPRSIPTAAQVGGHKWSGPATSGKYAPIAI